MRAEAAPCPWFGIPPDLVDHSNIEGEAARRFPLTTIGDN
jgi:hypothetical protein